MTEVTMCPCMKILPVACPCACGKFYIDHYGGAHENVPCCIGCGKTPDELQEYIDIANEQEMTPTDFVRQEEGTYNRRNGHFLCTDCYIEMGMPSSPTGWIAP